VRADAVYPLPDELPLSTAALTEPAACAVHCAAIASPRPHEAGLVVGAGPIGLLIIQALKEWGVTTIYCAELNRERLAMAEAFGAIPVDLQREDFRQAVDVAVDAVGITATRKVCVTATRSGGRVVWVGLHEPASEVPVNDMIRREVTAYVVLYTPWISREHLQHS
jgi:threonine dehydrogenase-like Zn-dependent dehydrogenase